MSLFIIMVSDVQREALMTLDLKKGSLVSESDKYVNGGYPKFAKVILQKTLLNIAVENKKE